MLRYSGIAFQMLAFIGLSVWLGIYLDTRFFEGKPIFVIFFTLFGSLGSIYYLYRALQN
ncbi:AtpZ/AtpI family protein [Shiella aurantiaca]|uniref:AtpZ/AtpI family protein n=1 Tax=Shiella aurantiaca TaxID=3058365 RepID=UPI0029F4A574|nr:AtpZ/AtpI family protein [Shiella aurantiaca]